MSPLPLPPAEVPADHTVSGLAPKFLEKIQSLLADLVGKGWRPMLRETTRSDERAAYLYGFGRDYDDGRGVVTNAPTALKTWHHFGLAVDIVDRRFGDDCPTEFWRDLGACAEAHGLTWGGTWHMQDKPHVQWNCEGMHVTPSDHAAALLASDGVEAVWSEVHAA